MHVWADSVVPPQPVRAVPTRLLPLDRENIDPMDTLQQAYILVVRAVLDQLDASEGRVSKVAD